MIFLLVIQVLQVVAIIVNQKVTHDFKQDWHTNASFLTIDFNINDSIL